jgi:L-asparaginase
MSNKPKIALITTGGTIAMTATSENSRGVFKLTSEELLSAVPQINKIAEIQPIDLFSVPSHKLTIKDFKILYEKIVDLASKVDGIVVTHGTDVLEESAFGLSLLLNIEIPVVLTGAMRRADLPGADGPSNLLNAVQVAASKNTKNCGVLVVMNGEILSGFFTIKQHSFSPAAFSRNPIGWIAEDRVRVFFKPNIQKPSLQMGDKRPIILTLESGFDHSLEDTDCIDFIKIDALIMNITGVGHTSEKIVPKLYEVAKKIPVIFSTRTNNGETFKEYYGSPGTETDLIEKGLIPGGFLNSRQIRMLLLIGFSNGAFSNDETKKLMSYFN